jgi:HK97 family phage major capsid protein
MSNGTAVAVPARIADLQRKRVVAFEAYKALADKETLTEAEEADYATKHRAVIEIDSAIKRARESQVLEGSRAQPSIGQVRIEGGPDPYEDDQALKRLGLAGTSRSLVIGGITRMCALAEGSIWVARQMAVEKYGESHPITRALVTSVGASGGFIVPPDYMNEIIELLRPMAVVRAAGPRVIPMPRGTMTLPSQTAPATANYGTEQAAAASSQQTVGAIVASFKKLTALVPVSNDMMRYADPAADAFVRDDLVKVLALRQDLAFLTGDGSASTPMGYLGFANRYATTTGGTAGIFLSTANSTAAVGGNWITSTAAFTLATVAQELGGLVNKLDTANVPDIRRVWFMHPRSYNYLYNVQNSLGVYVYRDELNTGKLLGYPVKRTTQIPINIYNANGSSTTCSFVMLAEMDESMILDSMSLELAVSREGTYVDANSVTWSAFQQDQTLIRAIAEHDFQIRHDASVAVDQFVLWAPAIS